MANTPSSFITEKLVLLLKDQLPCDYDAPPKLPYGTSVDSLNDAAVRL